MRKYFLMLFLLLLIICDNLIAQNTDDFYNKAIEALDNGDTVIAKVYFESAYNIQNEPKGLIFLFIIKCYDALNTKEINNKKYQYLQAEKIFEDLYQNQPAIASRFLTVFFSLREQISRNTQLIDDIIKDISSLIEIEKKDEIKSELYNLLGHFFVCNRNSNLAIIEYQKALNFYPKNYSKITFYISKAYSNLSYDFELNNNFDSALSTINQALYLDPYYPKAYYIKARIFYKIDKLDSALTNLTQAITLDTNYRDALILRAEILYKKEYWVSAIRDYSAAIRIEPNSKLYSYRGYAYLSLEKNKEAKADFTKAIETGMQDAFTYYNRGLACLGLLEYEQAVDDITKSLQFDTSFVFSFLNRGYANEQLGRYIDAIRDYTIALEKLPNETLALFNRGNCYMKLKKYENAIEDFTKCIEIVTYPDAFLKRAEAYLNIKQKEKAIKDLNSYLSITTISDEQKDKVKKFLDSIK